MSLSLTDTYGYDSLKVLPASLTALLVWLKSRFPWPKSSITSLLPLSLNPCFRRGICEVYGSQQKWKVLQILAFRGHEGLADHSQGWSTYWRHKLYIYFVKLVFLLMLSRTKLKVRLKVKGRAHALGHISSMTFYSSLGTREHIYVKCLSRLVLRNSKHHNVAHTEMEAYSWDAVLKDLLVIQNSP